MGMLGTQDFCSVGKLLSDDINTFDDDLLAFAADSSELMAAMRGLMVGD